jgi:F0F1-type ATP synthase assembly protein I
MWLQASRVSYLGIFFGVAVSMGYFFGRWLDTRFHSQPWLTIVGSLIGIAAGFKELYRVARRYQKEQAEEK